MDKMNWPVAAALMRHWFNGKPWPDTVDGGMSAEVKQHRALPLPEYFNETIVRMNWVLTFSRTREMLVTLRRNWSNEKAQIKAASLYRNAYANKPLGRYPLSFAKASDVESFGFLNFASVMQSQYVLSDLDELSGALANFNGRVFGEGQVEVLPNAILVSITRIGFYIKDSYDFLDDSSVFSQPLGFWNQNGLAGYSSAAEVIGGWLAAAGLPFFDSMGHRYFLVQNNDFFRYRQAYGRGGDYIIYSDIYYEELGQSFVFSIKK